MLLQPMKDRLCSSKTRTAPWLDAGNGYVHRRMPDGTSTRPSTSPILTVQASCRMRRDA